MKLLLIVLVMMASSSAWGKLSDADMEIALRNREFAKTPQYQKNLELAMMSNNTDYLQDPEFLGFEHIDSCPSCGGTAITAALIFTSEPSTEKWDVKNNVCPRGNYCACMKNCCLMGWNTGLGGCQAGGGGFPSFEYAGDTWCVCYNSNTPQPTQSFGTNGYPRFAPSGA